MTRPAMVEQSEQWMRGRLPSVRENLIANLVRITPAMCAPLREHVGRPAIVAGAGVSLGDGAPSAYGTTAWVANSAWNNRFHGYGVSSVYVCCESFETVHPISVGDVAFDVTAHRGSVPGGDNALAFFRNDAAYHALAARYGTTTLAYGSSVTTAAVALAARHHAPVIALIGVDCAIQSDGRYYASGARNGHVRAMIKRDEGGAWWALYPTPVNGIERRPEPLVEENGVFITPDFARVRAWLAEFARRHPHIRLLNASEGGVPIEGWQSISAGELSTLRAEPPAFPRFPSVDGLPLVDQLRAVRIWEQAVPQSTLWTQLEKLDAPKRETLEIQTRWQIEIAKEAAKALGLL